jgi:phenylpropionate dioxygenase-like ring-hydroxylating dioxygenase large terminal subunit
MIDRQQFVEMAKVNISHVQAGGTASQAPGVFRVPASQYLDPQRWEAEMTRIFKRVPLMLALAGEMPQPGDYKAMTVMEVPLLLTRGADGEIRAFMNSCSHRGAMIVEDGLGHAKRISCPYHNWTYNSEGDLVGLTDRREFGQVDTACLGLTPLPVAVRAGLVFVVLTPGAYLDVDAFLHGYDQVLEHFDFGSWELKWRQEIPGPNWKVAYDGYLDFYHLPFLHKNTFGSDISNKALYTAWGPHQRVQRPDPKLLDLLDKPEDDWSLDMMDGGVWTIFPHISFAGDHSGGMFSQLFPGPTWDRSVTVQSWFVPTREVEVTRRSNLVPEDTENGSAEQQAFMRHVVEDEDYYTGLRLQKALAAGAKTEVLFGRNEGGGHAFHSWVQRCLDDDNPFSRPIEVDYGEAAGASGKPAG